MEEINERLHLQLMDFDSGKRKEWVEGRKPFSVLFELTSRCNFNCIHCYLYNNHSFDELTTEQIYYIIDILYEKGILFLTFTGGEILKRKDFTDIYLYAKKKGFLVELFTNGYLFNDNIIQVLKEYPPLYVDISLYGSNEVTYQKFTGVKGAFEKVISNCRKLKAANIRVSLKSPIIKLTLDEIEEMKLLAEKLDIPFVYSFEISPTIDRDMTPQNFQVKLSRILENEFLNYFDQINSGTRDYNKDNSAVIKELMENPHIYACNVALNSFMIDYKGRMCPCMKLRHKGISLLDNDYDAIWNSFEEYSKLISSQTYMCRGCDARYYCDVCPAEMDLLYGDPEIRSEKLCLPAKIRKAFYEHKLSMNEALSKADS